MQPFNQNETGFTATAMTVTFTGQTDYDPEILDNPLRLAANLALNASHIYNMKRGLTL